MGSISLSAFNSSPCYAQAMRQLCADSIGDFGGEGVGEGGKGGGGSKQDRVTIEWRAGINYHKTGESKLA